MNLPISVPPTRVAMLLGVNKPLHCIFPVILKLLKAFNNPKEGSDVILSKSLELHHLR